MGVLFDAVHRRRHARAGEFSIEVKQVDGDTAAVAVAGEIDVATAARVARAVDDILGSGKRRLLIDLSATTFLDSSGLSVIVTAHRRLQKVDGWLCLIDGNESIARTLEMTGISTVIPVFATQQAAVDNRPA